ncbi:androgen-dependent TFPI-regulating protein-like [Onthophagus taurus]|uniref:androgen-dependent TFPI-regulating protein-like n=1 Tax=Onthophagus taurus TaxID=166361 RepID=UPI000C1FF535|nr:androgen-dependent TFPI-regulating protein-like [Onthophagus taurus]
MNLYLLGFYFSLLICYGLIGLYSHFNIDVTKSDIPELHHLDTFKFRYLTFWNMLAQSTYAIFSIYAEIRPRFSKNTALSIFNFEKIKGFLYVGVVVPSAFFVFGTFWILWIVDRELVFPKAFDEFVPQWINHCLHTSIVILPVVEFFSKKVVPSWKWTFLGITAYFWIYQATVLYTYYESSVWLYKVFAVLPWPKKICYMLFNYSTSVVFMHIAWILHNNVNCRIYRKYYEMQPIHKDIVKKLT